MAGGEGGGVGDEEQSGWSLGQVGGCRRGQQQERAIGACDRETSKCKQESDEAQHTARRSDKLQGSEVTHRDSLVKRRERRRVRHSPACQIRRWEKGREREQCRLRRTQTELDSACRVVSSFDLRLLLRLLRPRSAAASSSFVCTATATVTVAVGVEGIWKRGLGLKKHDAAAQACRVGICGPCWRLLALTQPAANRALSLNAYVIWRLSRRAQATPNNILHMARHVRRRPGELCVGTCLG